MVWDRRHVRQFPWCGSSDSTLKWFCLYYCSNPKPWYLMRIPQQKIKSGDWRRSNNRICSGRCYVKGSLGLPLVRALTRLQNLNRILGSERRRGPVFCLGWAPGRGSARVERSVCMVDDRLLCSSHHPAGPTWSRASVDLQRQADRRSYFSGSLSASWTMCFSPWSLVKSFYRKIEWRKPLGTCLENTSMFSQISCYFQGAQARMGLVCTGYRLGLVSPLHPG